MFKCTRCGERQGSGTIPVPTNPPIGGEIMSTGNGDNDVATVSDEESIIESTIEKLYDYIYNGSQLLRMDITTTVDEEAPATDTLIFSYDANGTPYTLKHNNILYYYVTNLQGDVIAILDSAGTAVVQYTYDAWGRILSTTGSLAETLGELNPLRYRGYVYDHETGLYYCQSRYYDPKIGRFINADALASTGQGVIGFNMFVYCLNNPIRYADTTGKIVEDAEEEGFRPVGAGIQVEVDIGSVTFGFEIIVYWDVQECTEGSAIIAVYVYGGGAINGYDDCLGSITATVADNITLLTSGTENGITELVNIIKAKYSASVSGLFLLGNEDFTSVRSYEGVFLSFSGNIKHIKGGVAVSGNCIAVSLGGISSASPSWGVSSTNYALRGYVHMGYTSKDMSQVAM